MNRCRKNILLAAIAVALMIGFPYVKSPGTCGITFPLAFTGAILGCGGGKESLQEVPAEVSEEKSVNEADAAAVKKEDKKTAIEATFVEIGAENCVPCKMMKPVMAEIEKRYKGRVNVVFHDVWTLEGKPLVQQYKIRVIPTQIFQDKKGKEFFRHEGFLPFDEVKKILSEKGIDL
jgi:thioredoxin 1